MNKENINKNFQLPIELTSTTKIKENTLNDLLIFDGAPIYFRNIKLSFNPRCKNKCLK